jgi:hypothetical protein
MPTKVKARTDVVVCCLAAGLFAVLSAVEFPAAYAAPAHTWLAHGLAGLWLGVCCVRVQHTSRQRWHLSHNTPVAMSATAVRKLYD